MIRKIRLVLDYLRLKTILRYKPHRFVLVVDVMRESGYDRSMPVITEYTRKNPEDLIIFADHKNTKRYFDKHYPEIKNRFPHIAADVFWAFDIDGIDIYISNHQISPKIKGAYSIQAFHGQPSKGVSIFPGIHDFDALFLFGPLQEELFTKYFKTTPQAFIPELFRIGYPKTDQLFSGELDSRTILKNLRLDEKKPTVLYAPAFNRYGSLQEWGMEIIELLASHTEYNVIVKLPSDSREPVTDIYATNGIDWFKKVRPLELKYKDNLRVYPEYENNSLLACSDILITCISGIAFDFLALNKPVIYIDTPKYFEMYPKNPLFGMDAAAMANCTLANVGREFGIVVRDIRDLPMFIDYVLAHPERYPQQPDRLKTYLLYNRGHATQASVNQISLLLSSGVKTKRPYIRKGDLIENVIKYITGEKQHIYYGIEIGLMLVGTCMEWC